MEEQLPQGKMSGEKEKKKKKKQVRSRHVNNCYYKLAVNGEICA